MKVKKLNLKDSIMKKNHFIARRGIYSLALAAMGAMFFGSCATDGFDENEKFDNGVTGVKLESPELAVKTVAASDGSDQLQVSWKVVYGAGGYECKAYNVDDPANPVELVNDTIDGTAFQFKIAEDTSYKIEVRTLGKASQNNTEADNATELAYSTLVPATTIPAGSDIAEFIKSNLKESTDEQAFELEAGGSYTCNDEVDFQGNKMTLRGNKLNHALVTMGEKGAIRTSAQLKVKFINFDCTAMTAKGGVVEMSVTPPASSSAEAQGVNAAKNSNKPADVFILQDPIIISDCAFKNVHDGLFSVGNCSWGIADFRLLNSVVQLNNNGSINSNGAVISGFSNKYVAPSGKSFYYGGIKSITVKESTVYNIVSNSKNRFVRFNNKDLDRVFPTASGSCTMTDNTFIRVMDKKEFGNNTPNANTYVINFDNNIFYDCYRLQKFFQSNCKMTWHQDQNTVWGLANSVDGTDKGKLATEEDAGFDIAETKKELDFTQPNFGINFTATGAISSKIGDPRWKATAE